MSTKTITFTAPCPHCEKKVQLRLTRRQVKHLNKASRMPPSVSDAYMARHLSDIKLFPLEEGGETHD